MVTFNGPSRRTVRLFELKFVHSESHLRNHFRQRLDEEQALQQLSAETGIEDEALLRRLRQFGLNGETVAALRFFPIAMVAWASGSVTAAELYHAEQAALFSELTGKGKAIEQFQRWLVEKPSEQWWSLWEDYVRAASGTVADARSLEVGSLEVGSLESEGHAIFELAQRIALASGGIFGYGTICAAEQQVLDRIEQAYATV